jgi:hypothetical protein
MCLSKKLKEVKFWKRERFWNLKRISYFLVSSVCALWNQVEAKTKKIIDENRKQAAACLLIGSHFPQWNSRILSISHSRSSGKCVCLQEWMHFSEKTSDALTYIFISFIKSWRPSLSLTEIRVKNSRRFFFIFAYILKRKYRFVNCT